MMMHLIGDKVAVAAEVPGYSNEKNIYVVDNIVSLIVGPQLLQ